MDFEQCHRYYKSTYVIVGSQMDMARARGNAGALRSLDLVRVRPSFPIILDLLVVRGRAVNS